MKIFPLKPMSPLDKMEVLLKLMSQTPIKHEQAMPKAIYTNTPKQASPSHLVKIYNAIKEKGIKLCSRHLQ